MSSTEIQESFNEKCYNGLLIHHKLIPEEILTEILLYLDHETLSACQLVCKNWLYLIQKKNFGRNLIKHKVNYKAFWNVISSYRSGNTDFKVEITPINAPPYPKDPVIEEINNMCYVPNFVDSWKCQTIDLIQELGFAESVLDNLQPTVKVSEWYTCEWGGWASYQCLIELELIRDGKTEIVKKEFCEEFHDNQNKWFRFEHEFKNYGTGLRKINFCHGAGIKDRWRKINAHTHKCKMAGACLTLEFPEQMKTK